MTRVASAILESKSRSSARIPRTISRYAIVAPRRRRISRSSTLKYQAVSRTYVAVCTLNSDALAVAVHEAAPVGLGVVGTLRTENIGIERIVKNTLSNPNIRRLVLCRDDTRRTTWSDAWIRSCVKSRIESADTKEGRKLTPMTTASGTPNACG